jgi:hypothetical protein
MSFILHRVHGGGPQPNSGYAKMGLIYQLFLDFSGTSLGASTCQIELRPQVLSHFSTILFRIQNV